jgi:hypothetical protein
VLPVYFHELARDCPQRLRRDTPIVYESPATAVRQLQTPQDKTATGIDVLRLRRRDRGVIWVKLKCCANLTMRSAVADKASLSPCPKRQRNSVQKDGFAGARLAGQNGQPAVELKIELVDQYYVADGQVNEHGTGAFASSHEAPFDDQFSCEKSLGLSTRAFPGQTNGDGGDCDAPSAAAGDPDRAGMTWKQHGSILHERRLAFFRIIPKMFHVKHFGPNGA